MCKEKRSPSEMDEKIAKSGKNTVVTDGKGNHILIDENGTPVFIDPDKRDSNFD